MSRTTFSGVQILRFVAAMGVVVHHVALTASSYLSPTREVAWLQYGQAGVDLFFVISGFIITYVGSTRETNARTFITRRIQRIVPPYWAWTILMFLVSMVPGLTRAGSFDLSHLALSLGFLNWTTGETAYPVLNVGWSLEYEMLFYLIAAATLGVFTRRAWWATASIMACFVLAGSLLGHPRSPVAFFLFNPIILEFVFGMVIAMSLLERRAAIVMAFGCGAILLTIPITGWGERVWLFGIPAVIIVAGVVWLDLKFKPGAWAKPLVELGNASYSIYLVHIFAVSLCCKILSISWRTAPLPVVIVVVSCVVLAVSYGGYLFVEGPLVAWFKRRRRNETLGSLKADAVVR